MLLPLKCICFLLCAPTAQAYRQKKHLSSLNVTTTIINDM